VRGAENGVQREGHVAPGAIVRVAAEQISEERRACAAVAADIHQRRISAIRDNREVSSALVARIDRRSDANCRPIAALIGGAEDIGQSAAGDKADVDWISGGRTDGNLDASGAADTCQSIVDLDPVSAPIVAAENALAGNSCVEAVGVSRIGCDMNVAVVGQIEFSGLVCGSIGIIVQSITATACARDFREVHPSIDASPKARANGADQHDLIGQ